ncbi:unnamed protein product [Cuscuta campestris]|uniref:DUF668 domain-containing protein n=1 Tax=Cuscuta campestris TaxID=132261 RepID=A0A484N598_9ASTE|nr:unnamed protein product [Cuscuta campestris]
MVAEFWSRSFWRTTKGGNGSKKHLIGVLAFEVSSLMAKIVHLWKFLSDRQVAIMREEIMNSPGIRKLVSEDDVYIVRLICNEIIENLGNVAMAVSRLAKNCKDPVLRSFEQAFNDLVKDGSDPFHWQMTYKKMDRKVKKMEHFVMASSILYQEMETLAGIAQTLDRMKCSNDNNTDRLVLIDREKIRLGWKQREVKHLKEISLWSRSYDYALRLLARSVFTVFHRVGHVFGMNPNPAEVRDSKSLESDYIHLSQSVSHAQSSVHPTEISLSRFSSEPLENILTKSGPISKTTNMSTFYSGPIRTPVSGWHKVANFYSGPLGTSQAMSGPISRANKTALKWWHSRDRSRNLKGNPPTARANKSAYIGWSGAPLHTIKGTSMNTDVNGNHLDLHLPDFSSKRSLTSAPHGTLGAAALALHYANVIIVIEKLVASPHLIGHDARDDLYSMLPANIRVALRAKLKPYAKKLSSTMCDMALVKEWNEALAGMLDWLAPLAHNMIRWQSERSFERHSFVSKTNMLLVQTLHFANQEKVEATITELLVGLNYLWRCGTEVRTFDDNCRAFSHSESS